MIVSIVSTINCDSLPPKFRETILFAEDMQHRLGIPDVSEFWLSVRNGRIPSPVWIPIDPPQPVWDKEMIETWIAQNCPVSHELLSHSLRVLPRLVSMDSGTADAREGTQA